MARRALAWSLSRLKSYEACPKQLEYRRLGTEEQVSPAASRGSSIHADAEAFLKGEHRQVPATLQGFAKEFRDLRRQQAVPEDKIAVTSAWELVDWRDPNTWLRIVVDAHHEVRKKVRKLIDFKTGRNYPDHLDQLELYALVFFRTQGLKHVDGELWYLDQLEIFHADFTSDEADQLEAKWRARVDPLLTAEEFPATPGRHCRWCGFASARGGPCQKDREA